MQIDVHHYLHWVSKDVEESLAKLVTQGDAIMKSQAELAAQIGQIGTQLTKVGQETTTLLQKVTDLQAAVDAAGNVTPELQAAVDALAAQAQVVDDLVPDAPVA